MHAISRALAAALLAVGPAFAQIKVVPEMPAPVGGAGVSAAVGGRAALAPSPHVTLAPTLPGTIGAAPSLTLTPGARAAAPLASAAAAPALAAVTPSAMALPAAAVPRTQAPLQAPAVAAPAEKAPTKGLEAVRRQTAEMGELLGQKGGGAQAGSQASGIASKLFDGGRKAPTVNGVTESNAAPAKSPVAEAWGREREALAERLAVGRGITPAEAAKTIDAFNAELGASPGLFAGAPQSVVAHFGRLGTNAELLGRLPKAAAAGTQVQGRAAPATDLPALSAGLRPAAPEKLGTLTAAFPVVDAQGRGAYLKTAFYRGTDFDDAGRKNAALEAEAIKSAALKRDFDDPTLAPSNPAPANVTLPKVLGFGRLSPFLRRAIYGDKGPNEILGIELETLPGRSLQSYLELETGRYRRADGRPVMMLYDFTRIEKTIRRMHALGWAWGDFHDGQVNIEGEPGKLHIGAFDFGTLHKRTGPNDAKFEELKADDLERLAQLKTGLFDESAPDASKRPLGGGELLADANVIIAKEQRELGKPLHAGRLAVLRRLGRSPVRQTLQVYGETLYGSPEDVVPIAVPRSDPGYRALVKLFEDLKLGKKKGDSDRLVVADAFYAVTSDGGPATFMTADNSVYTTLAKLAGIEPASLGMSMPRAFPDGFLVKINGRSLRVIPAGE
ncbi:MAG: hypothetical protein HYZ75_08640 [Elusimicrobia bacterium]|nr:hypothetical protein [Elusimicrobiota bacterium]